VGLFAFWQDRTMTYDSTIHSVDLAKYQPRARMMAAAELYDTNEPWASTAHLSTRSPQPPNCSLSDFKVMTRMDE